MTMIGRVLGGRYEILEKVGGGGMAVVYKAYDKYLNRSVAVKVLRSQYASDEDFVRRFKREAQAAASLSHPNIVNIFDVGEIDDTYYIVMEYVEGSTLKQVINSKGRLAPVQALRIAHQICEGLEHAHRRHVIHRDIKPQNILIARDGRAKVTDFGIARAATASTVTHTGTVIGSVHYFSPEQARGGFTGERSDVYSLGVVMYEMVTGKVPFQGDSPISIALKHMHEEIEPVKKVTPDVPDKVALIISRALRKSQSDRYQTASDMLRDIREAMASMGESAIAVTADTGLTDPEEPEPEEDRQATRVKIRRRRNFGWLKWLIPLVMLAGIGGYGAWTIMNWMNVPPVEVPPVVGKTLSEAERIILDRGLVPSVVAEKYDDKTPVSHIISQMPEAGESVKAGRTISLVVSKGQEFTLVPDITNKPLRDAEVLLATAGLDVGAVRMIYHATLPEDTIISQNPRKDTRVTKGTLVDVDISKGPEPAAVAVPDFVGESVQSAVQRIASLNLAQGTITEKDSPDPAGLVISQDPPKGSEVRQGTAVNLVVSRGPGSTQVRKNTIEIEVPDRPVPVDVKVTVEDQSGVRLVYRAKHEPKSKVQVEVYWQGPEAKVRIFFDDILSRDLVLK
ncbi:MAG: Stk1 family PASTA domain-containing Ser/Thr kinase [Firmicutes bacterium]|nr:Stk1 family PASTA domain-containing Ser/Thr kinase [Bacillota bacterium]